MADTAAAVVKGIIAALTADGTVAGLGLSGIFTDVPQQADFPYVVVSMDSEPFASASFSGQSHHVRIQAFSNAASAQQCLTIRAACLAALDRKETSITLDNGSLISAQIDGFSTFFKEDDGRTWQSVGELRVDVQ